MATEASKPTPHCDRVHELTILIRRAEFEEDQPKIDRLEKARAAANRRADKAKEPGWADGL